MAIDEDAVFLDVARDRYVCVPQAAALLRLDAARRVVGVADPGFAEELRRAGLAADGSPDRPPPPSLTTGHDERHVRPVCAASLA